MGFEQIYGHEKVKAVLQAAAKAASAEASAAEAAATAAAAAHHAYLLEGIRGVGKRSMALAFASALVCERPTDGQPCGMCKSCHMCAAMSHPDVRVVTNQLYDPDKKSSAILVDTVRQMKKEIYIKPYFSEKKVYILPFADTMNEAAQNSLLKVLEEPPPYCTIVLLAENANAFLPTILSRVVTLHLAPLPLSIVERALREAYAARGETPPPQTVAVKARMSGGSIGDALELMQNREAEQLRDETVGQLGALLQRGHRPMYDFIAFLKKNQTNIAFVLRILQDWFRDAMRIKFGKGEQILNVDKRAELERFCGQIDRRAAAELEDITVRYAALIDQNVNYTSAVQCMAMEYWGEIHDRNYRNPL